MLDRLRTERIAAASHVPTSGFDLRHLSNDELFAGTRRLVGASNQVFAMLLAHLAEVEARGLHRERACSSLYTYCIYELRLSEDAAFRRVSASRLVKRFPVLYDAIASGELHLTGLLMLGPHLTLENHQEVLERAKHRTKTELSKLLRSLDPLPDLPARIAPLGPAQARPAKANPSWGDYVAAWSPVRQLNPGDAPRDWMNDELAGLGGQAPQPSQVGNNELDATGAEEDAPTPANRNAVEQPALGRPARCDSATAGIEPLEPAPARSGADAVTGPLRYAVQFSAQEEYVQLVERAKALLSLAHGRSSLEEIHLRAMRLLVEDLEKRRFAKTARPRRSRYISAAVRREVFERDAARCTFVDSSGQRCRETQGLELHHLQAFALGGTHDATNVTLRCRAHNALAAEADFGRGFMEKKRTRERSA
jgi:hypothetical protein